MQAFTTSHIPAQIATANIFEALKSVLEWYVILISIFLLSYCSLRKWGLKVICSRQKSSIHGKLMLSLENDFQLNKSTTTKHPSSVPHSWLHGLCAILSFLLHPQTEQTLGTRNNTLPPPLLFWAFLEFFWVLQVLCPLGGRGAVAVSPHRCCVCMRILTSPVSEQST